MGIISFKSLNENEHCHRLYKNGVKTTIICKNKNCIDHMCGDYDCKKNKYFRYWTYNYFGNKIEVNYCENNCSCHLIKCIGLNKRYIYNTSGRKNSNDIYADPLILNCYSSDDNYHNFDFDFDD